MMKRVFTIPCRKDRCLELSNLILEKITVDEATVHVGENSIEIRVYGYKSDIKETWNKIKRLINEFKSSIRVEKNALRIKIDYLVKKSGKAFPPRVLVEVLKRTGYYAQYYKGDQAIVTNAPLEKLFEHIESINRVYEEVKHNLRGKTTIYYVIILSLVLRKDPGFIIEKGRELNHLQLDDEGKFRLRVNLQQALDEFIKSSRGELKDTGGGFGG